MNRLLPALMLTVGCLTLTGCSTLSYYHQLTRGHLEIARKATPLSDAIASSDPATASKLKLVQRALTFAEQELGLDGNGSYERYVDLERSHVLHNLYAAEEFSTALKHWCYPVVGCAAYRGYFDEALLEQERSRLKQLTYDTHMSPVTAYSTLGWFDDPVLNTFIELPEYRLVGLLFHELAHQQLYVKGDTEFNESFATAVERAGLRAFYRNSPGPELAHYRAHADTLNRIDALAQSARDRLAELYSQPVPDAEKRARKIGILKSTTAEYEQLVGRNIDTLNNASLGVINTYGALVPDFEKVLASVHGDLRLFTTMMRSLEPLDSAARRTCLRDWSENRAAPEIQASCPPRLEPPRIDLETP